MKRFSIFFLVILMVFINGCGTTVKITKDSMKTDSEKDDFIKSNTQLSHLHRGTQGLYLSKIDSARLNGKTAAILFADFVLYTQYTIDGKDARYCANAIADSVKNHFSQRAGLMFLPYGDVIKSPTYASLNFEEKSAKGVRYVVSSAYDLKFLNPWTVQLRPKYVVEKMAEIAKDLDVDYVMAIRVEAELITRGMRGLGLGGVEYPVIHAVSIDMVDKEKVAWSFSIPKTHFISIGSTGFRGLWGEGIKYESNLAGTKKTIQKKELYINMINLFDKVAEISAYKFTQDKKQ